MTQIDLVPVELVFRSDPAEVRGALQQVSAAMRDLRVGADDRGTVELVLAEVLNNIAEHAYAGAPEGAIALTLMPSNARLACRVVDYGRAMPGGVPPPGLEANLDVALQDLPEGGFGWFLIRELVSELSYRRVDHANELGFWLPWTIASDAPIPA
ncbi:MAG: ATP-binding protein [Pseudomonadota bacterium]